MNKSIENNLKTKKWSNENIVDIITYLEYKIYIDNNSEIAGNIWLNDMMIKAGRLL